MALWIWIVVILIVLVILFKFKEIRHKVGLLIAALFLIFLFVSVSQVYSQQDVDLTSFDGVVYAGKVYFSWLGNVFKTAFHVSNYVIHQDWELNKSNSEE